MSSIAMRSLKAVLVDLSGTIHIDDTEVPGSVQALERLCKTDLKVKFVTNTTKESKRVLLERLHKIGFNIKKEQVFTSLTAARNLIDRRRLSPLLLVDDKALEEFQGVSQGHLDSVVIGLAPAKSSYDHMNQAFRLLVDGAPLIAIHKARYYKRKDGLALGPGPFVEGLEYATGTKAEVVGKPEKGFFTSAIEDLHIGPDECVMIGDDARDDIGGAQNAGMLGILVKTGKYRDGDEKKINPEPHFVATDFSAAVDYILQNVNTSVT